jgi:hypothetical protein
MSFKQAMLMITNVFLIIIWILYFFWGSSNREYPKFEEMITFEGTIVAVLPVQSGVRKGFIDLNSNNKITRFKTIYGEEKLFKFGNIAGRHAIVMVDPRSLSAYNRANNRLPEIEHLELTNGPIIIDYKKELEDHSRFMKDYGKMLTFVEIVFIVFFIFFVMSLRKKTR